MVPFNHNYASNDKDPEVPVSGNAAPELSISENSRCASASRTLELLAPAKDKETGIAAINCGADAVYIAGPLFGARAGAGNRIEDIEELCSYAHRFGVRIYLTLNTIIYDNELEEARLLVEQAADAGVDAIIVQDFSLLKMDIPPIPLHASTQTRIRSVEDALLMQRLGFERIILERNLSLEQIQEICKAVDIEVEAFVHGAICVSYSGNCYMSCALTGRSANRGECIQACRNYYNLIDEKGRVLIRNKPLLSLKDYRLDSFVPQMVRAGVCSFKIEGRLKNISYVKNTVSHYNAVLNSFISRNPEYRRASFPFTTGAAGMAESPVSCNIPEGNTLFSKGAAGIAESPVSCNIHKENAQADGKFQKGGGAARVASDRLAASFNRGFTELFINGSRSQWLSGNSAKYIGQHIGYATKAIAADKFLFSPLTPNINVFNGDGLFIEFPDGSGTGMRANSVSGNIVSCRFAEGAPKGFSLLKQFNKLSQYRSGKEIKVFRNYNISFEREMEKSGSRREVPVELKVEGRNISVLYNGMKLLEHSIDFPFTKAENPERARAALISGLSRSAGDYSFSVKSVEGEISFYPQSVINQARRDVAGKLSAYFKEQYENFRKESFGNFARKRQSGLIHEATEKASLFTGKGIICDYRANIANHLAREVYQELGCKGIEPAFELSQNHDDSNVALELMRCKYCIRYELGVCLRGRNSGFESKSKDISQGTKLFLENEGRIFALQFDCKNCEMVIMKHTRNQ